MTTPIRTAKHENVMLELGLTKADMRKIWKNMPHTYLGKPEKMQSVRNARFNIEEVREWLSNQRAV